MYTVYIGMAAAAVTGVLMGGAFKLHDRDFKGGFGPQHMISGSQFDEAVSPVTYSRAGPIPEYVIGTDWTRPKVDLAYVAPVYEVSDTHSYDYVVPVAYSAPVAQRAWVEPVRPRASYPSIDGDILAIPQGPSAGDAAVDAVESFHDGPAQHGEISARDDQRGGQIDHSAHGPDPYAQGREAVG